MDPRRQKLQEWKEARKKEEEEKANANKANNNKAKEKDKAKDKKIKKEITTTTTNINDSEPPDPLRAKKRWKALLGRITTKTLKGESTILAPADYEDAGKDDDNLIEEIKRMKKKKQARAKRRKSGDEGILAILHSYHATHEKVIEKHKMSARERIFRRRASLTFTGPKYSITEFDNEARLRYPITSDTRIKLERIKREAEREEEKQEAAEIKRKNKKKNCCGRCFEKLVKWFTESNFGETFRANQRFYKMNPHEHLPELCRRCRRPLAATLEARFSAIGILFAIFLPIIGILLLYANQEFYCVVCNELYVYGDLTARPVLDYDSEVDEEEAMHM